MQAGDLAGGASPTVRAAMKARGYALVMMLAAIAVVGVGLAAAGTLWVEQSRREREIELIRVGTLIATAIAEYHAAAPGSQKTLPASFDALLLDTRFVGTRRHLRRLYPDPIDPARSWGVVRGADGGILGVYSRSEEQPLRKAPLPLGILDLPTAERYTDWRFIPRGLQ